MPFYTKLGNLPHKRHIQFRRPDGGLYAEEVVGTEGFSGPTSTMYHIHPPTQVTGWEPLYSTAIEYAETDIMRMRHLQTMQQTAKGDPVTGRVPLMGNADCVISTCVPAERMSYHYKNGTGDECLFIHRGTGTLSTTFGTLTFREHDFVVIPKGTIYRIDFEPSSPDNAPRFLVIETANASHILPPPRYLSKKTSQFLENAPYCERDLRTPQLPITSEEPGKHEVRIKALGNVHGYMFDYHPLDVVGWDGCYYPFCFNVEDFSPIVGKIHMPPTIHQVFEAHNFVICAFCPRMLDFHPEAVKVPYYHSNVDSDEIMYYVDSKYTARKGIGEGSITMHPQGIPHGPHPGTVESSLDQTSTDELVIMCDTFRPLFVTRDAMALDDVSYPESWNAAHGAPGVQTSGAV
jgi:homogentisate 1,2-dioxygenase